MAKIRTAATAKEGDVKAEVLHTTLTAKMKVTDSILGVAKFIDRHPELTAASLEFKNARFRQFSNGQEILCTFRKSPKGRRNLLHVSAVGEDDVAIKDQVIFGHFIPTEIKAAFVLAEKMAAVDGKAVMAIYGGSGYGKTSMASVYAKVSQRDFVRIDCSVVKNPEEWFGRREAEAGSTLFKLSRFAEALMKGNVVLCLDEVNRLEPWALNSLFPLLDHEGEAFVANQRFPVGPNTIFALTMNIGFQYTGTFELDEAFNRRIQISTEVEPLSQEAEIVVLETRTGIDIPTAKSVYRTAKKIRDLAGKNEIVTDCSTRATINIGKLVKQGLSIRAAFAFVIENGVRDVDEKKKLADVINNHLGEYSPVDVAVITASFDELAQEITKKEKKNAS